MALEEFINFSGGPCSGEHRRATASELRTLRAACKGTVYVLERTGPNEWRGVPAAVLETAAQKGASYGDTQLGAAWQRLMHTLAVKAPDAIRRQRAASARIRRAVR